MKCLLWTELKPLLLNNQHFLHSTLMFFLDFLPLSVWGPCHGHLFWNTGELQKLRKGHPPEMRACVHQQNGHCNGEDLFWTPFLVLAYCLISTRCLHVIYKNTVIQRIFFCLPRWTQMATWVCWQVAGSNRILMALHRIDGLAVCQSSNSGERMGWGQSNMASAGCLQESHAQVGLSQLNQWHHSQCF